MSKAKVVGHYVNSILASVEVRRAGYDEAMLLDAEGFVAECSGENIFIVRNGRVKTSPLTSVLPGITRDSAMTILRDQGVECREERFTRDEVYVADEAFLTGTAAEVTVIRIARDLGYELREKPIIRTDLYMADELFMTGTAAEVTPIRELDDRRIGDGTPGPVTKAVQAAYASAVRGEEPRYRSWLTPLA
jgi:branched-chain amino acid aminotransferase